MRYTAVLISVLFSWTNVIWPAIPKDENFWEGRRAAVKRFNNEKSKTLLAQLPTQAPILSSSFVIPEILNRESSSSECRNLVHIPSLPGLPEWMRTISWASAEVEELNINGSSGFSMGNGFLMLKLEMREHKTY